MPDLSKKTLRSRAGTRSYERALGYLDAVTGIEFDDETQVTATVHGTDPYEVELTLDGPDAPTGRCDCPYGQEGNFCKHLVALGLTLLAQRETLPRQRKAAKTRTQTLNTWLSTLTKEELVTVIREEMAEDRPLRRRLKLRAAASTGADLPTLRSHIHALLDTTPFARYGYVEYTDAHAYTHQAKQAAKAIATLTTSPHSAAAAVSLAREALTLLAKASEHIDDSDGGLTEVATALAEAHLAACRAARPTPEDLADWLLTHTLDETNDLTDIDPMDYADILGPAGMTHLRNKAMTAWRNNPKGWPEKYLMERLTKASSGKTDTDTLIAIHASDLSPNGHTHLLIARELDAANRPAEALTWAEQGIRDSTDLATTDTALVDDVCDRYAAANRLPEAVALRRAHFEARETLLTYRQLRTAAEAAGTWQTERPSALASLRTHNNHHTLIEALLDDGDPEGAWRTATETNATDTQWHTIADHLRPTHPAEALTIYLRLATPLTHQTGTPTYERLTTLLLHIRDCHHRLNTTPEFTTYLTNLRTTQKRKRNLLRLLDERGL